MHLTCANGDRILLDQSDRGPDWVICTHEPTGLTTEVGLRVLTGTPRDRLEAVLCGREEPQVLRHMTRVVGYFSRVENWNRSKLGELRDRQRGHYALPEA